MRRGGISGRADVTYHQPWIHARLASLDTAQFPVSDLGQVIEVIRYGTGTPPPYVEPGTGAVPFVRATDIKDGEIRLDTLFHIKAEQPKHMEKCRLSGGELIIVRSGVNTGDCAVVPSSLAGAYAAYDLVLTFHAMAHASFIAMFLDTEVGRLQLNLVRGRAAQPHVNAEEISALRVPLPTPERQDEFVSAMQAARAKRQTKLTEADALLAGLDDYLLATLGIAPPPKDECKVFAVQLNNLGKRIDAYSNQSRFRKLFAHIHKSNCRVATFKELSERIFSGVTPLAKGDSYVVPPDGVRFVRSGEITADGEVTPTSAVHISNVIHDGMMKRSQLENGDLLIAIVGATIGAAGVFNHDEPANINQAIAAVRLGGSDISPEFACLYLRSCLGQALLDYFKRPVARANINLEEIGEIPVLVPLKTVQDLIVEESHRRRDDARRLRAEAEAGWQAAKQWFEGQLLGTVQP